MLRLVFFFIGVLVLLSVLRTLLHGVPIIGALLGIPFLGFWIVAILLSAALSKLGANAIDRRKRSNLVRQLGAVETPHNLGKLGSLFEGQGRHGQALPYLDRATEGEPEVAEWHYRRGLALAGLGRRKEAIEALQSALALDGRHAYGAVLMRLAELQAKDGKHDRALESLERFERNHGPLPESAYRRGVALKALGHRERSRAALDEVSELASQSARYQKKDGSAWALRAFFARLV